MNTSSGEFTAPIAGLYTFDFHTVCSGKSGKVMLQLNGMIKAMAYTNSECLVPLSLNATLKLDKCDVVYVMYDRIIVHEEDEELFMVTRFSGRLL